MYGTQDCIRAVFVMVEACLVLLVSPAYTAWGECLLYMFDKYLLALLPQVAITMQANESQQALTDSDLEKLRSRLSCFLSKQQALISSPSTPEAQAQHSSAPQAASAPASKVADKAATPAKKAKGITEPAVPLLQTVPGQITELGKWSSMLRTNTGVVLQDSDLADWLAELLRLHCAGDNEVSASP